jgi:hypothetical protein
MKKITLTDGQVALVSDEDHIFLSGFTWSCNSCGYAQAWNPWTKKMVSMHRLVLERMGHKDFQDSDHINQNKLDNRRENLRPATRSQNVANVGKRSGNTSGHKGVSWCRREERWRASIHVHGIDEHLGSYDKIEDAARAYNAVAIKYFGEYAHLNEVN